MPKFKIFIDAKYSDEFVVTAKNAAEAKKKAVKRFAKVKNFEFYFKKLKPGQDPNEVWL